MDYIKTFDIVLEKEFYYAGEFINGKIVLENAENLRIREIRVILRGKIHTEWKVMRSGEKRTLRDDAYLIDEKFTVWGKERKNTEVLITSRLPILAKGLHHFPFQFQLPESALPCSFESKHGWVRYYIRVNIYIPNASDPQGLKYFSLIGPHIDCMDDKYLAQINCRKHSRSLCLRHLACCSNNKYQGSVALNVSLDRTAYCSGEYVKLKAEVQNEKDEKVWLVARLFQHVQYYIDKGALGVNKEVCHKILEFTSQPVLANNTQRLDLVRSLQVPVTPPTMIDVCKQIQIYYMLKVCLSKGKNYEFLNMEFPITIATIPFRIPNAELPEVEYAPASSSVEGGKYVSPEFQLGQVYMGPELSEADNQEDIVLYRPIYVRVKCSRIERQERRFSQADKVSLGHTVRCEGIPLLEDDELVPREQNSVSSKEEVESKTDSTKERRPSSSLMELRMTDSSAARATASKSSDCLVLMEMRPTEKQQLLQS